MTYKALTDIIKKPLKVGDPETLSVGERAPSGKRAKDFVAQHQVQRNRYAMDDDEKTNRFNAKGVYADEPTNPRLPSSVKTDHVFPNKTVGGDVFKGSDIYPSGVAMDKTNQNDDNLGEDLEEKKKLKSFRTFLKGDKTPNLDNSEGNPLEAEQFDETHFHEMDAEANHWRGLAAAHFKKADEHFNKANSKDCPTAKHVHHMRMGKGHEKVSNSYHRLADCCHGKDQMFEAEDFVDNLEQLDEFTFKLNPKKKGMFKGKSISDIKKSEKHDSGTKKKEDVFAINAKHHFHKEDYDKSHNKRVMDDEAKKHLQPSKKYNYKKTMDDEAKKSVKKEGTEFGSGDGSKGRFDTISGKLKNGDKKIGSQPFGAGSKKPECPKTNFKEGMAFGSGDGSLERLRKMAKARAEREIGSTPFGAGKGKKPECPTPDGKIGSTPFGAGTKLAHKPPGQNEDINEGNDSEGPGKGRWSPKHFRTKPVKKGAWTEKQKKNRNEYNKMLVSRDRAGEKFEETSLDEVSKDKLRGYLKKTDDDVKGRKKGRQLAFKKMANYPTHAKVSATEETTLDEISDKVKSSYVNKIGNVQRQSKAAGGLYWDNSHPRKDVPAAKKKHEKHWTHATKLFKAGKFDSLRGTKKEGTSPPVEGFATDETKPTFDQIISERSRKSTVGGSM